MAFFQELMAEGIYLPPSGAFYSPHHGWFRILFTVREDVLAEGDIS